MFLDLCYFAFFGFANLISKNLMPFNKKIYKQDTIYAKC